MLCLILRSKGENEEKRRKYRMKEKKPQHGNTFLLSTQSTFSEHFLSHSQGLVSALFFVAYDPPLFALTQMSTWTWKPAPSQADLMLFPDIIDFAFKEVKMK
jgi:hypothetical protein